MEKALSLTDPRHKPLQRQSSWFDRLALRMIQDERDLPFFRLATILCVTTIPMAILMYWPGVFRWWLAVPYWLFLLYYEAPYILMLHNTSHRRLFKKSHDGFNVLVPSVIGPLFGQTPNTYFTHHIGMHHAEGNLPKDLSSTMPYQRDSFLGFMHYFGRFFLFGLFELSYYHYKNNRRRLMWLTLFGELGYYVIVGLLLAWQPGPTLAVFVVPLVFTRFMMMAGNWGQHAFVDASDPGNSYRNSITCINCLYNQRAFNDGYHIGHHVKANRHWTEMPQDLLDDQQNYIDNRAIVFEGIDFFMVWLFLMLKRYDWLANRFVDLGGQFKSRHEVIEFLKSRTERCAPELLQSYQMNA